MRELTKNPSSQMKFNLYRTMINPDLAVTGSTTAILLEMYMHSRDMLYSIYAQLHMRTLSGLDSDAKLTDAYCDVTYQHLVALSNCLKHGIDLPIKEDFSQTVQDDIDIILHLKPEERNEYIKNYWEFPFNADDLFGYLKEVGEYVPSIRLLVDSSFTEEEKDLLIYAVIKEKDPITDMDVLLEIKRNQIQKLIESL